MSTKHTPGPWTVSYQENTRVVEQNRANGEIGEFDTAYFLSQTGGYQDGREQEANARLIAAAPELLEALKRLCELPEAKWANAWKPALTAIARAEGREPAEQSDAAKAEGKE